MSSLSTLKLTAVKKPTNLPAVQQRRNKLVRRLGEQMDLAKAQQGGIQFKSPKTRTYVDKATGVRTQVEVNKRVKAWWFTADNGKLALCVRYGTSVLELAKGKFAVELASEQDLLPTLEMVKTAVIAGELDTAIDNAANKLRDGFVK